MAYTKQEFKSGATLYASQLNAMDAQIAKNEEDAAALSENVDQLSEEIDELKENGGTGEVAIVGTAIGAKCTEFTELFNGTDKIESFIFFTDPHLTEGRSGYESQMRSYLKTLKTYYDATPTNFVVCGGDWIGNSDTITEACFKLGFINGTMRSLVEPYYPVVGNHDTNYQGKSTAESTEFDGTLTNATIRNLFVPGEQNTYYSFDGANTKIYVLDTGSDWDSNMDAYRWEQVAWLADKLKTDDATNSAIILHIGKALFAQTIYSLCHAYNQATTITLNGVTYDFTTCRGKVKFALAGHTHLDSVEVDNGIIVATTTNMRDGNVPTFDLCLVDYDKDKMYMVRVGSGKSRVISLIDGSYTESEDNEDVVENDLVLLLGMNLTGRDFVNNVKNRSVYIQRNQPKGVTRAVEWSSASTGNYPYPEPYYPIEIPDGAQKMRITCPSTVKVVVHSWSASGWNDKAAYADSGWLPTGGGTYDLPDGIEVCQLLFEDVNDADMTNGSFTQAQFVLTFE